MKKMQKKIVFFYPNNNLFDPYHFFCNFYFFVFVFISFFPAEYELIY